MELSSFSCLATSCGIQKLDTTRHKYTLAWKSIAALSWILNHRENFSIISKQEHLRCYISRCWWSIMLRFWAKLFSRSRTSGKQIAWQIISHFKQVLSCDPQERKFESSTKLLANRKILKSIKFASAGCRISVNSAPWKTKIRRGRAKDSRKFYDKLDRSHKGFVPQAENVTERTWGSRKVASAIRYINGMWPVAKVTRK